MITIHSIYHPVLIHFRLRRAVQFYKALNITASSTVLDIGGSNFFWRIAQQAGLPLPARVTILNLYPPDEDLPDCMEWQIGDARRMAYRDGSFDVAFSNSVIEHVGAHSDQMAMASETRRVAKSYWVQTPDPRFPIEPHYFTPFVHWLPEATRRRVLPFTVRGLMANGTGEQMDQFFDEIRLIRKAEFKRMFPDGQILIERFSGFPKSLIAWRPAL